MSNSAWANTKYGEVATFDALNGGFQLKGNGYKTPQYDSDPVVNTRVLGVSPAQTITTAFGSVTVNSIIEVYPLGIQIPSFVRRYISDITVSAANTART